MTHNFIIPFHTLSTDTLFPLYWTQFSLLTLFHNSFRFSIEFMTESWQLSKKAAFSNVLSFTTLIILSSIFSKRMVCFLLKYFKSQTRMNRKKWQLCSNFDSGGDSSTLWDRLIFSKIKQLTGGRVRLIVSGAAPLSPKIQDFLRVYVCFVVNENDLSVCMCV